MATLTEALAIATEQHKAGNLQAAEQIYRDILALDPHHAHTQYLLGLASLQSGKIAMAVEYMLRAIHLKKDVPLYHNHLGEAYRLMHRLPEAIASCRRAVALQSGYADGLYNLAHALSDDGQTEEAIACYRKAINLAPDNAAAHSNLGSLLRSQGKLDLAIGYFRKALKIDEHIAEAHANLGAALTDQGKLDEALASCRRAIELKPGLAIAHVNLGTILRDLGRPHEAMECFRHAVKLNPEIADAHNNLASVLLDLDQIDEAEACCRKALELRPNFAGAYNNLGTALKAKNRFDEAIACFRQALVCESDFAFAHANLGAALEELGNFRDAETSLRAALQYKPKFVFAHFKLDELLGGNLPDIDLARQRELACDANLPGPQRSLLHFGLAHVLDARGAYAEAAAHAERANALQVEEFRMRGTAYDSIEARRIVEQTMAVCTPDFFARVRGFGVDTELPVFIVGLPRAGTTLVEQILASHPHVMGAGELMLARDAMAEVDAATGNCAEALRSLDRDTAQNVTLRYLEKLRMYDPQAMRIADKTPENYLLLGLLATLFPNAKFIHCRRDLRDVALSCWMTQFRTVRWANDIKNIANQFGCYLRLMEHWNNVLPTPLLDVVYEDTIADLETTARKLVAWCGLEWDPRCLDFHEAARPIKTASLVQVRQPIYRTAVGRWKHYEQELAPLWAELDRVLPDVDGHSIDNGV